MWNYSYILPSTMILLIFLAYYFLRPRLPLRMNTAFVLLLLADLFTILMDYISSRMDENFMAYSIPALYLVNMGFFVGFVFRTYLFTRFTFTVLENYKPVRIVLLHAATGLFIISELLVFSSPISHGIFYIDEGGYHSGSAYIYLTYMSFLFMLLSLLMILCCARKLPGKVVLPLVGSIMILTLGIIIRLMRPDILIMDTFFLMAIILLFLSFQNPSSYLNNEQTSFNGDAFHILIEEWHRHNRPYSILGFVIHGYNEYRGILGGPQMDQIVVMINKFLQNYFPQAELFYLEKGRFALAQAEAMDFDRVSQEIRSRFEQPWNAGFGDITLQISFVQIDSSLVESSADRINNILLIALENAGRSRASSSDDFSSAGVQVIEDQLEIRQALDHALDNDAVEIFLQPIIDSSSSGVIGAEALARVRNDQGQILSPAVFIPLAEKGGQIDLLGEQMFRKTCAFIRDHDLSPAGIQWINVNLSPYQFSRRDLVPRFSNIMEEYGVGSDQIHLEITEQALVDYSLLQEQIRTMQEAGFHFVLDDYGTGYSNLIRLRQYPFHTIKIDMEVVWDYCRDPFPILPAFIQSLKQMGLSITAEGIEDEQMAKIMTEIGCDYLQGYYYSKPVPAEEFLQSSVKDR